VSLCATLLAGGTVVIAPRFSVHHFWEWIERERITWASIVPTIVALLLSTDHPAAVPETLRFVRTASAPLPVSRHMAFERRFGIPVIETYGLSEAASMITANPLPPNQRKPGSVGLPTGVELRICAPDPAGGGLQPLEVGQEGEICVRGPQVIASYEGEVGADSFCGGWFRTGDLGRLDDDGYVYITGRLRDTINRGGEKVSPREIEEVLLAHPETRDAAVAGEPDPLYGQRIIAYVVTDSPWSASLERRLRDFCAARLSAYKIPERFHLIPALPRNANGKLARRKLSELGEATHAEGNIAFGARKAAANE
ncbi:MAG TPA: AMP-binding protein, partial [Ktedonobacterales bacterium]|nr:AMP-binding protein [Ktedonobacterales bacterium]